MDMGIVNAGQLAVYEDIPAELRERCEDVILNRRDDATDRLLEIAERYKGGGKKREVDRSEEHTSELQSLMRNSYAVFCLKKKQYNLSNYHITKTQSNKLHTSDHHSTPTVYNV